MTIHWSIEHHEAITSTQDIVRDKAEQGADEGLVISADMQSKGRGRHGRSWESQPGNLFFSLLLRPQGDARCIGQLGLVIGVSLAKALQGHLKKPDVLTLKWPNDLLLDGQKCAGILIEAELDGSNHIEFVTVGCGVNMVEAPNDHGHALVPYLERAISNDDLLEDILAQISRYHQQWQEDGFAQIQRDWMDLSFKKGVSVQVRLGDQRVIGYFAGIDDDGALLLEDEQTKAIKTITAGDVYMD